MTNTKNTKNSLTFDIGFLSFRRNGGFTLVELIVTVGIFAIISSVVLVRNSQFDNEVLLADVAYDVALSIRQAQNYGIHVLGQGNEFDKPYGVYFEAGENAVTYKLFLDVNGNYKYDSNQIDINGDEALETFTLGRGFSIARICDFASDPTCGPKGQLSEVHIVFVRPNPDAIINADEEGNPGTTNVGIELVTPRGGSRLITVQSTGQISISKLDEGGNRDGGPDTGLEIGI